MIKNRHTGMALFSSDLRVNYVQKTLIKSIFKILFYTPPDLSPRFTCKGKVVEHKSFSKHKKTGLFYYYYYFGLPFRQMNATCKLVATEDDSVLHKIMFRRSLQRSGWRDYE